MPPAGSDVKVLEEKIDNLKEWMEHEFRLCRENCKLRLENLEDSVNLAHSQIDRQNLRLDRHAESIACLTRWKNRLTGAFAAVSTILFAIIALFRGGGKG